MSRNVAKVDATVSDIFFNSLDVVLVVLLVVVVVKTLICCLLSSYTQREFLLYSQMSFLEKSLLSGNTDSTNNDGVPSTSAAKFMKNLQRLNWKRIFFIQKVCCYVFILTLWIAVFIVSYPDVDNNYEYKSVTYTKPFKVILFGDSLMNVGYTFFNLGEKLQHQFPHVSLTIINSGVNGDKIADMKARMYTDVVDQQPDAVLIYWDSDVSDLSLEIIETQSTQQTYEANCVSVFTTCQNASRFIAVAGPGILNEGPLFHTYEWYKGNMLDTYRSINKNISETFNISYIDLRGSLKSAIPSTWLLFKWYVSSDGEHENARGTRILAREFGKVLNGWLSTDAADE